MRNYLTVGFSFIVFVSLAIFSAHGSATEEDGIILYPPDLSPNYRFPIQENDLNTQELIESSLRSLKLKNGIKLYNVSPVDSPHPVAVYNGHTLALTEENIFYFIEPISSARQMEDLWRIFDHCQVINSIGLYQDIVRKSREFNQAHEQLKVPQMIINKETPDFWDSLFSSNSPETCGRLMFFAGITKYPTAPRATGCSARKKQQRSNFPIILLATMPRMRILRSRN